MNETIIARISALRMKMKENGIDFYMIPTSDYHNSEYVADFFKTREFFSNFTGSNGTLLVSMQEAFLWTDGRYFIQAEKELRGTGITLMKIGETNVPTIAEYLSKHMDEKQTLGFDGKVCNVNYIENIKQKYEQERNGITCNLCYKEDLAAKIWTDRPTLPHNKVQVLPVKYHGNDLEQKLKMIRSVMKQKKAGHFFLSKLDDIMWLYNIRGCDVMCNPVTLSYAFITEDKNYLFIQQEALSREFEKYAKENDIELKNYSDVFEFLETYAYSGSVIFDKNETSYYAYDVIKKRTDVIFSFNLTELPKAIKNETEISKMKEYYLLDSVAVCKFIYWLKHTKEDITEMKAAAYLDELRSKIKDFRGLSFPTISAYGENAAMMHYEANKKSNSKVLHKGFLLVDSGGQYLGATTDVTRTICMGPVSDEEKKCFSLVLSGMLQLMNATFLYGCTGRNLDILARIPLWNELMDYKCGTGHGVGCFLNVHEGPQNISWKYTKNKEETILEEGMTVTDEPGVYIEGKFGIRTENVLLVIKKGNSTDGQFMGFVPLTYVPIDLEGIDISFINEENVERLNEYHAKVYKKISPYLEKEEKIWLDSVTKTLKK